MGASSKKGEARPAGINYKPPVEVVEGASPARLSSVTKAIWAGAFVALTLGSDALLNWTSELPIGSVSDFLVEWAQRWEDTMSRAGMTEFAKMISGLLRAFQTLR